MSQMLKEITHQGVDKTARYGWITKDAPGELRTLHKDVLQIHPAYQRDSIPSKIRDITAQWSFVACGAIVVGARGGEYWVIDGQHRVLAAKRRSDITHLPCVIFHTEDVKQEAVAFLDLNTGRKPVSTIGKFKAMIAAGDESAVFVRDTLESLAITPSTSAHKEKEIKSLGWALKKSKENPARFEKVMRIACDISKNIPIQEKLLDGLWYIDERIEGGITNQRFSERIHQIGAQKLIEAANKASAYFVKGGASVWAQGMIDVINRGLQKRFEMKGSS